LDFDRETYLKQSSNDSILPLFFLEQILQCSTLFQRHQIETIEYNLFYFHNQNRRFLKELHRLKGHCLDEYLDRCQVRELLLTDRHLLKTNFEYKRFIGNQQRITRQGTFINQHQRSREEILEKIQNGFFCSNSCKQNLCSVCQIIRNPSIQHEKIFIGHLIAKNETKLECIYGKSSNEIKNSCFCNRYLLDLCSQQRVTAQQFQSIDKIENLSPTDISENDLIEIQQFTRKFGFKVRLIN